ncbi:MAG TPA: TIGR00282 family metallophosphoesterase [Trueperaceae bacterium]|nr:TIGR00282 family metallophosphoesterase [Trueperaceae bacterium]
MKLLFIGDVFGTPGVQAATAFLRGERARFDFVIVNGENAAGGFGITRRHFELLIGAGADVVTLGNHSFDQAEALELVEETPRLLRPANYPAGTPGLGAHVFEAGAAGRVGVVQVMGRIFMDPLDDPFRVVDDAIERIPAGVPIVVEFHAEATSEKKVMLHHLAGRVAALVGTHTHVQTADETIYKGTAYLTDVGMTGVQNSSIGMRFEEVHERLVAKLPRRYRPATGPATVCAVAIEIAGTRATAVERIWHLANDTESREDELAAS